MTPGLFKVVFNHAEMVAILMNFVLDTLIKNLSVESCKLALTDRAGLEKMSENRKRLSTDNCL